MKALERATRLHRNRWGEPGLVVRAPGRVNLIGEHTDYNDGFTLPMALPFDTVLAISSHSSPRRSTVTIESEGFGLVEIDPADDPATVVPWAIHLAGVIALLAEHGIGTGGWRAGIATDIPTGAGLSSSAALEVATITGLLARAGRAWKPIDVALLGQRVEHEVVGVRTGIMDQFISAGAVLGHASLMDCRALSLDHRPLPGGAVIAIMDTGTRRVLAEAAYGERRDRCERAAKELDVRALRDATVSSVARITDPITRRRALHVVTEDQRTLDAAAAMQSGNMVELGRLMSESHASLRDDFEVSGPGLDQIVEAALAAPGCLGARMTGGGFAGCAVALVDARTVDEFTAHVLSSYQFDGHRAQIWTCTPAAGASVLTPS